MRQISDAFAARLAADVTSLCLCWRWRRTDAAVFGATDHDEPVAFGGLSYEPANGLQGATFETSAGLAPGRAMAEGALSLDFMTEADLGAGLWNGAKVEVWRVDWKAPEHGVCIWSGQLSEVSRQGTKFTAELVSLKADLERPIGRVYSRQCDADVGDARCKVDLFDAAYRAEGVVIEALGAESFLTSGLGGFDSGWFAGGVLSWTGGANVGAVARVLRHASGEIELAAAPRFAIEAGDSFTVTVGCDKGFAMCGARFNNRVNFRGFPHMPAPEAVLAGPAADQANDGGRRG
ncbi:MAG TPA: DUF2163 domain-containing protein [Hyphomonadaceae bacterium]|nr:DUF2163 domain-containing protein [Hyphomonadaceae bacterium]